jgi:Xaa-Pro aminopeptidase
VLIDAGAELDGYASDITRSFPVNGHFSGEQRALYELSARFSASGYRQSSAWLSFQRTA